MLFSRFFKQPKPNKFGYTPLYYNEQEEKRNQRIKSIEREVGATNNTDEFDSHLFRERFASKIEASRSAKTKSRFNLVNTNITQKNTTKVIVLLIVAGVILYWQIKN